MKKKFNRTLAIQRQQQRHLTKNARNIFRSDELFIAEENVFKRYRNVSLQKRCCCNQMRCVIDFVINCLYIQCLLQTWFTTSARLLCEQQSFIERIRTFSTHIPHSIALQIIGCVNTSGKGVCMGSVTQEYRHREQSQDE